MSIDQLVALGADQISAQFAIIFPNGLPGNSGADTNIITMRQDKTFPWPTRETGTYETFFQGQKIVKHSVVEATDKKFTIEFRLDQDWKIFTYFNNWFKLCYDEFLGTTDNDSNKRVPMVVVAYGAQKQVVKTAAFQGVTMYSFKISDVDQTSGEPTRVECGFIYYFSTFD